MSDEMKTTRMLRSGRNWLEVKRIDPRGLFWLVLGGTTAMPGDVVCFPGFDSGLPGAEDDPPPRPSPCAAEVVVDSVTGAVLLPESGSPASRLRQAMKLVRDLEAADLSGAAQMVRDALRPTLIEDFRERNAA